MTIKGLRISLGLTQIEASRIVGVPLRTYKNYENDSKKINSIKYGYIVSKLQDYGKVDEEHGLLTIEKITEIVDGVFSEYEVDYCYLFGSYAKHTANEKSDVDLLVSTNVSGLKFFGLVEKLRTNLKKRVDLLSVNQLKDNTSLVNEILKYGVKIY